MSDVFDNPHWYQRFDTLSFSTQEFYSRLYAETARRQMPDIQMVRAALREGGLLQGYRDYLRVSRGPFSFNICAAPFGIDFFVSWWLLEDAGCLGGCLTLFPLLRLLRHKTTFYEADTGIIFMEAMHQAVLETVDSIFHDNGETRHFERRPTVRGRLLE